MRAIDASKLVRKLCDISSNNDEFGRGVAVGISTVITEISKQPTLTLDDLRPKGRWNIVEIDKAANRITVECAECGMVEEMYLTTYGLGHNYCHSCGADMRGGGEDA